MSSKSSPATPRPKMQRGPGPDGERISPAIKKGTVIMLGENSPKATRSPRSHGVVEKKTSVSRGAELQQVHEELAKTKEQLSLMEKSKSNLLQDLARSKRQLEDLNSKLQDTNEVFKRDRIRVEEVEQSSVAAAEELQGELDIMRKQYEAAILDSQTNQQAIENLKHELFVCTEAKDEAVRLAGEAMNAAESTAKRVEEMSAELLAAKGSNVMAASAPAIVQDLVLGSSPTNVPCGESILQASDCLVAKEGDLQASLQEVSQLRFEVQSLKEELSLSQLSGNGQVNFEKSTQDAADFLATKESELLNALQELSHYRSLSDSLREELSAVQLVMVQNDKKTLENMSLMSQKDTELQSALQEAGQLQLKIHCLEEELSQIHKCALCQPDGTDAFRLCQSDLSTVLETEKTVQGQLSEMTLEVNRLGDELVISKSTERNLTMQLADAASELGQLKVELAAASEAKGMALSADNAATSTFHDMIAEVENGKEAESAALALLSKVSTELKEAQGELVKANLEGSMLASFLESLKTDLERKQSDITILQGKEVQANEKVESLKLELIKTKEMSKKESRLLSEQLACAQAAMIALKVDADRQSLALIEIAGKEASATEKVSDVTRNLQNVEYELADIKKQLDIASNQGNKLELQLDMNLEEMSHLKTAEQRLNAIVSSLTQALEEKEHEVIDLKRKLDASDIASSVLRLDLESTKAELVELKHRETNVSMKAIALSVVLASLTENNELKLNEFKEREAAAIGQVEALHGELVKTKVDLQEAIMAGKAAKDEGYKLQISLELATLELDQARQESQKFLSEAACIKEDAGAALAKLKEAEVELDKTHEAKCLAELSIQKQSRKIESLTLGLQTAHEKGIRAEAEIELLSNKLGVAMREIQEDREEMEKARQEGEAMSKNVEMMQSSILMYKEQTLALNEQLQAARNEVEHSKNEMYSKLYERRAHSSGEIANHSTRDVLEEPELRNVDTASVRTETVIETHCVRVERVDVLPQDDLETLKVKVHQTEEHLALALKEIENSQSNTNIMLQKFETMRNDKEANERALVEVHQHLADTEKAKSNLEAEIQRLLDESKQWQTLKDAVDIPIQSGAVGCAFSPECRDEKPQPDSPNNLSVLPVSPIQTGLKDKTLERLEKVMKEHIQVREDFACLSLRRDDFAEKDEFFVRDDVSLCEETITASSRKKKKTLLVRLGSLLEKKKHGSQQMT